MAALRQLLNRGLLAGRRLATAPPRAPRAFSTTTGGRHHVSQYLKVPNGSPYRAIFATHEGMWEEVNKLLWLRYKNHGWVQAAVLSSIGLYCLFGHVAPYLPRSSKSPSQETQQHNGIDDIPLPEDY